MRPSTLSSIAALAAHAMAAPQLVLPSGHLSSTIAAATSAVVGPKAAPSTSALWGPAPTEAAVADPTEQDEFPSVKTLVPTLPVVLGQKFAHSAKTTSTNTNTPVIAGGKPKSTHVPEAPNMANVPGTSPRAFHCKVEGCFYDDDGSRVNMKARDVNEVTAVSHSRHFSSFLILLISRTVLYRIEYWADAFGSRPKLTQSLLLQEPLLLQRMMMINTLPCRLASR